MLMLMLMLMLMAGALAGTESGARFNAMKRSYPYHCRTILLHGSR